MPTRPNDMAEPEEDFPDEGDGAERRPRGDRMKRLGLDLIGRWHWILLGLILGLLGGLYYLSKAPKIYSATATLLVKQQTATVMSSHDPAEAIDMRSVEAMNTVAERLKRFELLERVASRQDVRQFPGLVPRPVVWLPAWASSWFGSPRPDQDNPAAGDPPPEPAALAGMISGWMQVSIRRYTRLLDVSIEHPVPEVAKAVADAIAREYIFEMAGTRSEGRTTAIGLLTRESEKARAKLEEAQRAISNYQRALDFQKQLELKETEARDLARRYLPKHPKMIACNDQLHSLQERFLSEFDNARTSNIDKAYWESSAEEWDSVGGDLTKRLTTARRLLLSRATVLESEIASQTSVFNTMLTRMQEADINEENPEAEIEISNLARSPGMPTKPKPAAALVKWGAGGFAAGLAIAFLLIKLDNKFHTVAQVENDTGLPVLAAISSLKSAVLAAAEKHHHLKHPDPPPAWERGWDRRVVFRHGLSATSFAEMFRVLRASLTLLGDEKKRKVALFTSAIPGEGKTLISANLALAAAGQGKRVLVIDLDLRKPALHKVFGLAPDSHGAGITECLAGKAALDDAIQPVEGIENLHLMLSGTRAPNPGELLNGTRLAELIGEARKRYDLIILDTAPLLAVPDTRVIAPFSDNLCLVARAEYTPKGAIDRALELLQTADTSPAGIVFNGFLEKRRLIGYNYSYGYYKYGQHGHAYRYGYGQHGTYGAYGEDGENGGKKRKSRS